MYATSKKGFHQTVTVAIYATFTVLMKILCVVLLLIAPFLSVAQQAVQAPFETALQQSGFLKNNGQVTDFNQRPVDVVLYEAGIAGEKVYITKYGLSILLSRVKSRKMVEAVQPAKGHLSASSISDSVPLYTYDLERIDILLEGAAIREVNISTVAMPATARFSFYTGNSAAAVDQGLEMMREVLVKNVYPGIDWKVYIHQPKGQQPSLKYDFIVHPGADPSLIKLRYSNNAKINLQENEINAKANMGVLREDKPYSYLGENNTEVKVDYVVRKNTISFKTANYNRENTLVIDPSIFWMTYLSSLNKVPDYESVQGVDVETDAVGNIFTQLSVGAKVPFPTKDPGAGAYIRDYTSAPNGAMVINKFAPGGQLLWSTYFGNGTAGSCMTIDRSGNIVAIGRLLDGTPSRPVPNPEIPLLDNGGFFRADKKKYFITRFTNSGVLTWSSYYLHFASMIYDMSYDVSGNVFVVGSSEAYEFPVVDPGGGAYVTNPASYAAESVLFIAQFNAASNLTWSTRIEGNDDDPYVRVCADKVGNVYIGGQLRSSNYPLIDAGGYFNTTSWGAAVTRFNAARQITWSTMFPGAFSIADITVDDSSNLYVVADKRIWKFNNRTEKVFETTITNAKQHFFRKINYDPYHKQLQIFGNMNDWYYGFPTKNTTCNGSFYTDGTSMRSYPGGADPIFVTMNPDGQFSYVSLANWPYEYYERMEMCVDVLGNPIYLFGDNKNGAVQPNPQLTDPGNGAYFDPACCTESNGNISALLLKLLSSELTVDTTVTPPAGCGCDGAVTTTVLCGQAPFTYEWSTGATTADATGLCPGEYWVRVTDATNLSKKLLIKIPNPPGSVSGAVTTVIPENCDRSNGRITIQSVDGGAAPHLFSLNGGAYQSSNIFNGLDSGSYILRIKDAGGCIAADTILVSRIAGPIDAAVFVKKSSCAVDNGEVKVNAVMGGEGPYLYTLSGKGTNSTGVFTNLAAANYQLTVADTAGCSFTKTIVVQKASPPTGAVITVLNDHCNQNIGSIEITNIIGGEAPYTFSMDSLAFTSGMLTKLSAGSYTVYIKDANGCVLKKEPVSIVDEGSVNELSVTVKQAYCGKTVGEITITSVLGGTAPYFFSIDSAGYSSANTFTNILPGDHKLYVRDKFNCVYEESFTIDFKALPLFTLIGVDTAVCYGESVTLRVEGDKNMMRHISWNIPARGDSAVLTVSEDKRVSVSVEDVNGCVIVNDKFITMKACNPPERCLVIPNAFTPNNDGLNDLIVPVVNGCRVDSIMFKIYNRWGEIVYETTQLGKGWNGVYKNNPQPPGSYAYVYVYITEDGIVRQQKGSFVLIR